MPAAALTMLLLTWLSPHFEASGVQVVPVAMALALAVGATALWGWRMLAWVALAALTGLFIAGVFGTILSPSLGTSSGTSGGLIAWPDAISVMSALTLVVQAAVGGLMLRRSARADDLALDHWPAIRRLLFVALVCGAIGGLMQVLGDLAWSPEPSLRPFTLMAVRTIADSAGIVIGVPVWLSIAAPQRGRWLRRRRMVALPLLALMALILVALALIHERDRQQALSRFERDAEIIFARTQALLDAPLQTLLALRGAFSVAATALPALDFDTTALPWVKRSVGMGSVGWMEVAAPKSPSSPGASAAAVADPRRASELRHVAGAIPLLAGAASVPTRTVLDLPEMQQTAQQAARTEAAVVSAPLSFGGGANSGADAGPDTRPGFVVVQRLPGGNPGLQALAFATVTADALMGPVLATRVDAMRGCIFDTDLELRQRRLAGPPGCEIAARQDSHFVRETAFDYGGRRWAMRVSQAARLAGGVWLFALPALAGAALLAMLLLSMTGQVQRVQHEARSRSDELRHEIDSHARADAHHERTLHAMLDTVQIGMAVVDPDGRIARVNTAFAVMAGDTPEALRHRLIDDVLIDDERPSPTRFTRLISDASDELLHQPVRLRNADGRVTPTLVTLRVLRDESGRALSAVCAVHDLSENLRRRQIEQVLGNVMGMSRGDSKPAAAGLARSAAVDQRLLCIAADTRLPELLRSALHDRPNVSVLTASDTPEGLMLARSQAPNLVLLDLDLPHGDSLATMRTLSREGIPVVALSRDLRPARIDEAFAAGARAYLTLPPEARELLAVLDDLM